MPSVEDVNKFNWSSCQTFSISNLIIYTSQQITSTAFTQLAGHVWHSSVLPLESLSKLPSREMKVYIGHTRINDCLFLCEQIWKLANVRPSCLPFVLTRWCWQLDCAKSCARKAAVESWHQVHCLEWILEYFRVFVYKCVRGLSCLSPDVSLSWGWQLSGWCSKHHSRGGDTHLHEHTKTGIQRSCPKGLLLS